jgi:hypothetical protein
MIERINYGGWANCLRLHNDAMEVVVTTDVGPRVIRCALAGGENVFKEYAEQMGGTGEDEWTIRGGHRLWVAPEDKPRSYALDNAPVAYEALGDWGVRLMPAAECETGVRKEMELILEPDKAQVTAIHRVTNENLWEIELAAWAPTVMAPGGMAIIPLPPKRSHTDVVTPECPLVLWPYTDLADSRWRWGTRFITVTQDPAKTPGKVGLACSEGWAAYWLRGNLFVKYFDFDPMLEYPDMGTNFQTFSNEEMLEVESMGPLVLLGPGDTVEHVETWRLFGDVPSVSDDASIEAAVVPLVEGR